MMNINITRISPTRWATFGLLLVVFIILSLLPTIAHGYTITLITDILRYVVLAVGWMIFSGPTNYMSLATAAFMESGSTSRPSSTALYRLRW